MVKSKCMWLHGVLLLILFSWSDVGYAQDEIKGQVLDLEQRTSIVFATIRLKQNNNGFIADENGYFRLPNSYKKDRDTLVVSSIGYTTKEIPIAILSDDGINTILLKPKIETLDEVTVIGNKKSTPKISGVSIVKKAIDNIFTNYATLAHSYVGYYRDYQLVNNEYLNLNEAIIEVFDAGIQTDKLNSKYNQTALYTYHNNLDFPRDEILAEGYDSGTKYIKNANISGMGGNELSILNLHDPIRNHDQFSFSFIDVFRKNFIGNHEFKILKTSYLDDIPIYEIAFKDIKLPSERKNVVEGKIYIDKTDFAIHRLEYHVFNQYKDRLLYSLKLEYASKGKHMYLNYISFNNLFQIRDKKSFSLKSLTLDKDENAFILTFTNPVHKTAIKEVKNFKFLYKKRRLSINTISFLQPHVLKVSLLSGAIPNVINLDENVIDDVTYKIKNVTDVGNRKLDKRSTINVSQFRELFVQEVFPVKPLPQNIRFLKKKQPLSKSISNPTGEKDRYWINTPLKKFKE